MKAALLGATGPVGKRLLQEMLDRGHAVTAIVRNPGNVPPHPNVTAQAGDIDKPDELVPLLRGHDAVIVSIRFLKMDASKILGAVRRACVPRYLMVGGAASLYLPGTRTKVIDSGRIPAEFMVEPTAGIAFFSELKQADDLDWTFLSPPRLFLILAPLGFAAGALAFKPEMTLVTRYVAVGGWFLCSGAALAIVMAALPLAAQPARHGAAAALVNQAGALATFINAPFWQSMLASGIWSPFALTLGIGWIISAGAMLFLTNRFAYDPQQG